MTPPLRVRALNSRPVRGDGDFVLYWMTAFRRVGWNFALQRAIEHAVTLGKPLVVLEMLRVGGRWDCDRFHRFAVDGMIDNAAALADKPVRYVPMLERTPGEAERAVDELARSACVVTTDDHPHVLPPSNPAPACLADAPCLVESIDANGLLPMRAAERTFTVAHSFRRWLQRELRPHLDVIPRPDPFKGVKLPKVDLPKATLARWTTDLSNLARGRANWSAFPINHDVPEVDAVGGTVAGRARLAEFVAKGLPRYAEERSDPDSGASSGMSPYLRFGHVSSHEILAAVAKAEGWTRTDVTGRVTGKVGDWWGASPTFESFMEELVVWRELGLNMASREPLYDRYESLPQWARSTLQEHASDPREHVYDLATFERADTHDPLWNAAQRELVATGRMHNYMRMLWGKKILEWTASPQEASLVMIELNNKWALDGQDPNSYSGIFWTLGRYDRPWAPQRPIFGSIRYMSSDSTRKKLKLKSWLSRWGR